MHSVIYETRTETSGPWLMIKRLGSGFLWPRVEMWVSWLRSSEDFCQARDTLTKNKEIPLLPSLIVNPKGPVNHLPKRISFGKAISSRNFTRHKSTWRCRLAQEPLCLRSLSVCSPLSSREDALHHNGPFGPCLLSSFDGTSFVFSKSHVPITKHLIWILLTDITKDQSWEESRVRSW